MAKTKTAWMVKVAMLSAIATVLMLFEFPLPFIAPPFYELDFSEVPVLVGAFAMGPSAGVAIEGLKIILNLLINGSVTGGVGEIGNFVIGVAFVSPAAWIYDRKKTKGNALKGLCFGGAIMAILGGLMNAFILLPAYGKAFKMPVDAFVDMAAKIWPAIDSLFEFVMICVVPFNLVKILLVSLVTMLIYKPLSPLLKGKKEK